MVWKLTPPTQLISIAAAMRIHDPPISPGEMYSQGFWHALLASILYLFGSLMLVVNMFGYVRGHYPQRFDLDDDQRTLILQTMLFFFWLAAGAGIYTRLEGWSYSDALYFADVVSSNPSVEKKSRKEKNALGGKKKEKKKKHE